MTLEVALWRKLPALRRAVPTDGLNRSSFKWRAFGDTDQALSERKHRLVWSTDSMTQTLLKAPAGHVTLPLSSGLATPARPQRHECVHLNGLSPTSTGAARLRRWPRA